VAVGEELLRRYVFIHLEHAADKLQLMLAMLHKLYSLVGASGSSWSDFSRKLCCVVMHWYMVVYALVLSLSAATYWQVPACTQQLHFCGRCAW
jgi:hypothetical protein